MGKRQEIRARRKRAQIRDRVLVILGVVIVALLVTFGLIVPGLTPKDIGTIVEITPDAYVAQVDSTSMGDPQAPVRMDVWEDFQCSGCMSYSKNIEPQVIQTFVETGQVYYTFHFYPFIDGGQGESHQAANAAMCAEEQGRFWDYHKMLFANWTGENVGDFTGPRLDAFAQALGLDMAAFNKCYAANAYAARIQQDYQEGGTMGVPPTPGIFIDGKVVVSSAGQYYIPSFDDISAVIQAALNGQ
jgi:protein-disulfide isomerase